MLGDNPYNNQDVEAEMVLFRADAASNHPDDTEIDEKIDDMLAHYELEQLFDARQEGKDLLTFWDVFQDLTFPIRKHGNRFRVRH